MKRTLDEIVAERGLKKCFIIDNISINEDAFYKKKRGDEKWTYRNKLEIAKVLNLDVSQIDFEDDDVEYVPSRYYRGVTINEDGEVILDGEI